MSPTNSRLLMNWGPVLIAVTLVIYSVLRWPLKTRSVLSAADAHRRAGVAWFRVPVALYGVNRALELLGVPDAIAFLVLVIAVIFLFYQANLASKAAKRLDG